MSPPRSTLMRTHIHINDMRVCCAAATARHHAQLSCRLHFCACVHVVCNKTTMQPVSVLHRWSSNRHNTEIHLSGQLLAMPRNCTHNSLIVTRTTHTTHTHLHLHTPTPTSTSTSTSAISTHSFVAFHLISLIDVFAYPNGAIVLLQLLWPARVSRVLQMPRGNMLMVGMGGSGRRSSCRLAASIADCRLMTIQVTKTYSQTDWRDDLKKILMTASFNLNHTVFLFTDAQVSRNEKLIKYKWKFANICIPFESENMQNHKKIEFSGFKMNACVCVSA